MTRALPILAKVLDKVIERLMDLLNDPDHTTRHRIVFILGREFYNRLFVGRKPDERIIKALTQVIAQDKNWYVRLAAFKPFWSSESRSVPQLPQEVLYKVWLEKKLALEESELRKLLESPPKIEREREEAKYNNLINAIVAVLTKEKRLEPKDYEPLSDNEADSAMKTLAEASEEELQVCMHRGFNDSPHLRWKAIKGSRFEQTWKGVGLPASETEEKEALDLPRRPSYGAEDANDPIWELMNLSH